MLSEYAEDLMGTPEERAGRLAAPLNIIPSPSGRGPG